ncbi:cell division ATP-binding protein FtsE [Stakelama pacifica]|uniref:Cell division ATP-binding protein FtsE n=1 Tax=Stakelama pacifica TaxID=517720 RepID=A0A4R6FMX0_9SPHN|nr:cell division ATP-binding protein FtsE [Stakelama pacifica]TDN82939.1 cell division transport system ATP-binding protein [Stakelama pacifica]GGO95144.1 ABC transporter ATP-binding protein [Stakelama pacifica]
MANIVQFENVGLRYGPGPETLTDISFTLERGAFHFITGTSGAGKTSLLRLLYLANRPTRGIVRMFDEDVASLPRSRMPLLRRRIGVVFQDFRLLPHLSTYDNVALPLRIAGIAEREVDERLREMLDWVGLSARAGVKPATLSGGEQQRAGIARAVIAQPDLLIADEPTGNVDPDMAKRLMHLFESLNRLGKTVVVATHDHHLMNRVPQAKIMEIDQGRLTNRDDLRRPRARPVRV